MDAGWATKDVITIVIAAIGAMLGVLNWWNAYSACRVRILIKPSFAYGMDVFGNMAERPQIGIEVINLSAFAVTVAEVGFTLKGTKNRASALRPIVHGDKSWPCRLEAREAVSVYINPPDDRNVVVEAVFARLASGERIKKRGEFIKNLHKAVAAGRF